MNGNYGQVNLPSRLHCVYAETSASAADLWRERRRAGGDVITKWLYITERHTKIVKINDISPPIKGTHGFGDAENSEWICHSIPVEECCRCINTEIFVNMCRTVVHTVGTP